MTQTIMSITAIFLAAGYPLYFLGRRDKAAPPLPLSSAVLSVATLELFDLLTLLDPEKFFFWKKCALATEAALPIVWLWFTLTYARQNESPAISLFQRLLLVASPLFAVSLIFFPANAFFYSPDFAAERVLFLGNVGFIFYLFLSAKSGGTRCAKAPRHEPGQLLAQAGALERGEVEQQVARAVRADGCAVRHLVRAG